MSNIVVMTFDSVDEAAKVRQTLRDVQRGGHLNLDDAAVIAKDAAGKVQVHNEVDTGVKWGALGGAILGPLLMFLFPLAGIALGAAGGALVGSAFDRGVDQKFVKDVKESLKPNSSALFVMVRDGDPTVALEALRPYKGTLYHTSLGPELEEELRRALK